MSLNQNQVKNLYIETLALAKTSNPRITDIVFIKELNKLYKIVDNSSLVNDDILTISCNITDRYFVAIVGLDGAKGDKGDTGDPGIQGIQGEKGDPGVQGVQGEKGDPGDPGIQGIQGIQGEKGDKGDQGDPGTPGGNGEIPLVTLFPREGYILPLSTTRAYYEKVLYSDPAIFNNGSSLFKLVAFYGNGTNNFVAYSNDGITWTNETQITGVVNGYHCEAILVGTDIHLFYWNTGTTIYSPASTRHAIIDSTTNCSIAISDAALSGNYITGVFADGLRYGTYGVDRAFYNASPTNNIANPYSYQWCIIHNGTDGSNEGILFATSSDGYNFTKWNNNVEVIPRGAAGSWDSWIGSAYIWKEGSDWYAYYAGGIGTSAGSDSNFADGIGLATSGDGINWVKSPKNPEIFKTYSSKTAKRLYCPCVVQQGADWIMYYTAKDRAGNYRVCTALVHRFL